MTLRPKFWYNFNHKIWIEGILNKVYRAQHRDKYRVSSINKLHDKVLNLAIDPKEHFNLGLHIIQHHAVIGTGLLRASATVCCIKLITESCTVYIFNVYCPCDTVSNDHLQEYNDVLSTNSNCLNQHNVDHCVIAGDFNTDLSRVNSGNTISLKVFINEENLFFSLDKFSNRIPYTFTGIRNNHSLIDHFIVSQNLVEKLADCFIAPSIDNLSDIHHCIAHCLTYALLHYVLMKILLL